MTRAVFAVLTVATLAFTSPAFAQADDWERVRVIGPEKRAVVRTTDGREMTGVIRAWSADSLTFEQRGKRLTDIRKADVDRVSMVAGMTRAKRAGWAALIGGGIGFAAYTGLCAAAGCGLASPVAGVGGGIAVGGISAAVAALLPQHKEVIWRRR